MWLVVGLGNPGSEYARTRHNLGFMVVDQLAERIAASPWKIKLGADVCEGKQGAEKVILCKPMEFMNLSGEAVGRVAGFWKVPVANILVVHDELDLPFGQLRLGAGGGPGGHNGVRSLIGTLGPAFNRVRVGISKPPAGHDGAGYVLGSFTRDEQKELPFVVTEAREAVEAVLTGGLTAAMNKFNSSKKDGRSKENRGGSA
jgi:peptidyl-tRNA hydrolase, PTH1 family